MKRMAVPAAFMSMVSGMSRSASNITSVSSQSDRLSGIMPFPASAFIMSARLLMLFEAGRSIVALIVSGALRIYCIVRKICNLLFSCCVMAELA